MKIIIDNNTKVTFDKSTAEEDYKYLWVSLNNTNL